VPPDATIGEGGPAVDNSTDAGTTPVTSPGFDAAAIGCPQPCAGTIVDGRCVTTLATNQMQPRSIASDGVTVFWTNGAANGVMSVPVCGGHPMLIAVTADQPNAVAVDGTHVYWTETSSVKAWSKTTGVVSIIAPNQASAAGLALAPGEIYWTDDVADGGILRAPLDGGAPVTVVPYAGNPYALVVSPTTVYWYAYAGDRIFYAPLTGGSQTLFFYDSNSGIAGLGIDQRSLYYTEQSSLGPLGVVPLDGGAATAIAHDNGTWGVVSDGTYVYYSSPDGDAPIYDGAIVRVPIDGGAPTTLATGNHPEAIALDATGLYWASSQSQTIGRVSPR
jgi:hypothetical protein